MAALGDVAATLAKLEHRHQSSKSASLYDDLIEQLERQRAALRNGQTDPRSVAGDCKRLIERFQKSIADDQKETYNAQIKYGKAVAKRFKLDLTAATDPNVFSGKKDLINHAIALDFMRQGQFDMARSFAQDADLELDSTTLAAFHTMYSIIDSLERNDLSKAIEWAAEHGKQLEERNSTLEFELHKAQFIRIFQTEHVFRCIEYATNNFHKFSKTHLKEIGQLMCATTMHKTIATSPYASWFQSTDFYMTVKQSFMTEFTALLSMTPSSPLQTTIEAANLALPTLIKLSNLKIASSGTSIDLPLPRELRFHSVFVCPVTKEVGCEAWMLACGHVIGVEAMHSLAKGTQRVKCPYCPTISEMRDALKLKF